MEIIDTEFDGLKIINQKNFEDIRGSLRKIYTSEYFKDISFQVDDIYLTKSCEHVFRGFHGQKDEYSQAKYVSCIEGEIIDYAIDVRHDSKTRFKIFKYKLISQKNMAVLIPPGFLHAIQSISDKSIVLTICSGYYVPEKEYGVSVRYGKNMIDNFNKIILSEKDSNLPQEILQ